MFDAIKRTNRVRGQVYCLQRRINREIADALNHIVCPAVIDMVYNSYIQ